MRFDNKCRIPRRNIVLRSLRKFSIFMNKPTFSGHESFVCKQFWLKKVFDFAKDKKSFTSDTSVVDLGVGKNMVSSLRFWGKSFGMLGDDDSPTDLAKYLFGSRGKDVYLEDLGTIWLLHYNLVTTNRASIYNLFFNEFRKERLDFSKEQLHAFLKRKCDEFGPNFYNPNTITTDINVFLRSYIKPSKDDKSEIEDDFSGLIMDLNLIKHYKQRIDNNTIQWYKVEAQDGIDLPYQIMLYTILKNYGNQKSISFRELQIGQNSPGAIFSLNPEGLLIKLEQIVSEYTQAVYTETAGNQILQFRSPIDPEDVLNDYYQAQG